MLHAVDVAALQVSELDRRLVTVQESTQALEDGIYDQVQPLRLEDQSEDSEDTGE